MDEKRKSERKETGVFFGVYSRDDKKYVGRLVNINADGIMIIGKDELKPKFDYRLKMDLPKEINGQTQIVFDATCRWCDKGGRSKLYSSGFQFLNISNSHKELIEELVNDPIFFDASGISGISIVIESGG